MTIDDITEPTIDQIVKKVLAIDAEHREQKRTTPEKWAKLAVASVPLAREVQRLRARLDEVEEERDATHDSFRRRLCLALYEVESTAATTEELFAAVEQLSGAATIPRHLRIALASMRRTFESGDFSGLGTFNEDLQPVVDTVAARMRRVERERDEARRAHADTRAERDEARAALTRAQKMLAAEQGRPEGAARIGMDTPWPLTACVHRLCDAADHLLHDHNCDTHGYEEVIAARDAARGHIAALEAMEAADAVMVTP